ncbi:unnamed protein product [marine sediment metagenome]|uniref:Uncharacterized protein n=1 Tax=marine sediment metagenome TaxID=412755 RepID=X1LX08_9ZZZZ
MPVILSSSLLVILSEAKNLSAQDKLREEPFVMLRAASGGPSLALRVPVKRAKSVEL